MNHPKQHSARNRGWDGGQHLGWELHYRRGPLKHMHSRSDKECGRVIVRNVRVLCVVLMGVGSHEKDPRDGLRYPAIKISSVWRIDQPVASQMSFWRTPAQTRGPPLNDTPTATCPAHKTRTEQSILVHSFRLAQIHRPTSAQYPVSCCRVRARCR